MLMMSEDFDLVQHLLGSTIVSTAEALGIIELQRLANATQAICLSLMKVCTLCSLMEFCRNHFVTTSLLIRRVVYQS